MNRRIVMGVGLEVLKIRPVACGDGEFAEGVGELPRRFNWQSFCRGLGNFLVGWLCLQKSWCARGWRPDGGNFIWLGLGVFSVIFLKVERERIRKSR